VKVYKHAEYYLSGKFKSVPDPSFIVVRSPHKKLTKRQRERKFNKKHGIAWYPSFPISEARTKAYSYGMKDGT
tara:strand:- start:1167 stop:1385 length:219 start_codon:yes stop_codon:yes gene_type:complete